MTYVHCYYTNNSLIFLACTVFFIPIMYTTYDGKQRSFLKNILSKEMQSQTHGTYIAIFTKYIKNNLDLLLCTYFSSKFSQGNLGYPLSVPFVSLGDIFHK